MTICTNNFKIAESLLGDLELVIGYMNIIKPNLPYFIWFTSDFYCIWVGLVLTLSWTSTSAPAKTSIRVRFSLPARQARSSGPPPSLNNLQCRCNDSQIQCFSDVATNCTTFRYHPKKILILGQHFNVTLAPWHWSQSAWIGPPNLEKALNRKMRNRLIGRTGSVVPWVVQPILLFSPFPVQRLLRRPVQRRDLFFVRGLVNFVPAVP